MLPYWFLFLVPAFAALAERPSGIMRNRFAFSWLLIWSLFTILIGFRYKVGGDWGNYERALGYSHYLTFDEVLLHGDPGYTLLNWLVARADYGIALVNLVCGAVFAWGLIVFARQQPRPWLAIAVAVPYLVIVVAMGYSRQGVAVGFAMLALVGLGVNSALRFAVWITMAALFHKTAVLLIPIAILAKTHGRIWTTIWIGALGVLLYYFLLADDIDALIVNYIEAEYQSQGATIRVMMNALPAAVFLLHRRDFRLEGAQLKLWTYLSLAALGFVILLVVSTSSTAVDRMALYLIPVQIFVLSRLPSAWQARYGAGKTVVVGVVIYSALVLFVWLNFAQNARFWLPYQMMLFSG